MDTDRDKLIIGNCSGFFGDRLTAAGDMVRGGPIDVLCGDYLAELTMAILHGKKARSPEAGFVPTFLRQMEEVMAECLDRGIKVVSNAGGLNPAGLAAALEGLAKKLGIAPRIAYIEGDDLWPRLAELGEQGEAFVHMDKGIGLLESGARPITANAYLGGWGIAEALGMGADIVVTGRVADAALVAGPAAWRFGWRRDHWDRLAGAYAAGHIIECGCQATGGNYSFFEEVPSFSNMGFPIAQMYSDGSCVVTKHPGTGGLVSVGTVTAQLLYEIAEPAYLTPDVVARFDTLELSEVGPDRVLVRGARGEPAPDRAKVCINTDGGFRNSMTVILTGLDIGKKARIVEEALFESLGGRDRFAHCRTQLIRSDKQDPATNEEAFAYLRVSVRDPDRDRVDRAFSAKVVELALSSIPGFQMTGPPTGATPAVVHWPALVSAHRLAQRVVMEGETRLVEPVTGGGPGGTAVVAPEIRVPPVPGGPTVRAPLGRVFATRAGDKGGNANLGVWAKTPKAFAFLREYLTGDRLRELMPDMAEYGIKRYELPNLYAVNFVIQGVLGEGAAATTRSDPQAKTLGEYLRARVIDMPEAIIGADG